MTLFSIYIVVVQQSLLQVILNSPFLSCLMVFVCQLERFLLVMTKPDTVVMVGLQS